MTVNRSVALSGMGSLLLAVLAMTRESASQDGEPKAGLEGELAKLLPSSREQAYREIPWKTDLLAARAEAAKSGKPLFLWVMDGHPLGCT